MTRAPVLLATVTVALLGASGARACGVERWSVKSLGDNPTLLPVRSATVAKLGALPVPASLGTRSAPEHGRYVVAATLAMAKLESDGDYHLVLTAGGVSMIAEIPDPACVASAKWRPVLARVRASFESRFGTPGSWTPIGRAVRVTGVLFLDYAHGQRGHAANYAELHPVLALG